MGLLSGIVDEFLNLVQCIHFREKISYSDQDKWPFDPCQYCARYQDLYTVFLKLNIALLIMVQLLK